MTRVITTGRLGTDEQIDGGFGELKALASFALFESQIVSAMIHDNGPTVGAWSDSPDGTARSIAFRSFRNNAAEAKTFKVKAVLDGHFKPARSGLPSGPLSVGAAVRVFNTTAFVDRLKVSGVSVQEFLLGDHTLSNARNLPGLFARLRDIFPGAVLGNKEAFSLAGPGGGPVVMQLETDLVAVGPQETFTVMFDVATFSAAAGDFNCHLSICGESGYGSAYFIDALSPAPDFFVGEDGSPVAGIEALGPSAAAPPMPMNLTLRSLDARPRVGGSSHVIAEARTAGGAALAGAVVKFEVIDGPNARVTGGGVTDEGGSSHFVYSGTAGEGVDSVRAWVGVLGSNVVQTTWQVATRLQFSAPSYEFSEGAGRATLVVTRAGDRAGTSTVAYQTVDDPAAVPCDPTVNRPDGAPHPRGAAYARCDYATAVDLITFQPGEQSKEISIPLVDDAHAEGAETLQVRLFNAKGATLDAQSTATVTLTDNDGAGVPNPVRSTPLFVRMHYLDFLSREPEPGEPWTGVLDGCPNPFNLDALSPSAGCDRITVSRSFFGSPEFSLKGFYVFNFYRVAFDRLPTYEEIIRDMSSVTGPVPPTRSPGAPSTPSPSAADRSS